MRRRFENDSELPPTRSPRNLNFPKSPAAIILYSDHYEYPTSKPILHGQVTADGMIIGCRPERCLQMNPTATIKEVDRPVVATDANDQSFMVVLVAHDYRRSVALSISNVLRDEYVVVAIAHTDHLGLFLDGVLTCSTRSPNGKTLAAGISGQRGDFLLRAPSRVFKSACQSAPVPEAPERLRKSKLKQE